METDPLIKWNELNKSNAEHAFVSAMYTSVVETGPIVDKFSTWLLAGTGATGALLISQIESVLPYLGKFDFRVCISLLVISSLLGFLSKYFSILCQIQVRSITVLPEKLEKIFSDHEKNKEEIIEIANKRGITLETEIDINNVLKEFSKPFPKLTKWMIQRQGNRGLENRQIGYQAAAIRFHKQAIYTFLQGLSFVLFLCSGAWFAQSL
ncbi:hypothetical protein [Microbulbifer magnicolonia]|uniref:hypothetical protein n=1 Tax=Microbulbifer magnicolonia TaxID=3109744 RepID=UPI002B408CB1|nr:hypothetical protein [Microbulbifer sp. GG15]